MTDPNTDLAVRERRMADATIQAFARCVAITDAARRNVVAREARMRRARTVPKPANDDKQASDPYLADEVRAALHPETHPEEWR